MAIVFEDHIQCEDTDPILAIRMPQDLMDWVEDAANIRGISIEELINETLFDYYHRLSGNKLGNGGHGFLRMGKLEYRRRETLRNLRSVRLGPLPRKPLNTVMDKFNWDQFYEIRKHNIAALELEGYKTKRPRLYDPEDVEQLRIELEKRGIKRARIRLDGDKISLTKNARKRGAKDITQFETTHDWNQKTGMNNAIPKSVTHPTLQKALDEIDEATGLVAKIRKKREERRAEQKKGINNPTN